MSLWSSIRRVFGGKKKCGGTRIDSDKFNAELHGSLTTAHARLKAVGAPVSYPERIIVSFVNGSHATRMGWGYKHPSGIVGGMTVGKHVAIATTPSGEYQELIAQGELSHSLLRGTEKSDYEWMRRAGMWS